MDTIQTDPLTALRPHREPSARRGEVVSERPGPRRTASLVERLLRTLPGARASVGPQDGPRDLDARVELEQGKLMARQLPVLIMTGTFLPALLSLALAREIALPVLLVWMAPLVTVAILRLVWMRELRRHPLNEALLARFLRNMFITALITGSVWGSLGIILYATSTLPTQLLLLVVITGLVSGAVNSLGSNMAIFLAFSIPILLPHIAALGLFRQEHNLILAVLTLAFLLSMTFVARNTSRAIHNTIRLRFENEALAEERDRQRRLAEEASADKSRFLAAASHDLRQPLHALSLFFGSLQERNRQADLVPILEPIKQSLDSLHGLFSSLMDLSKLDAGAQRPSVRAFSLAALLNNVEVEHFVTARAKGLSLRVFTPDFWVASDRVMLKRMLDNLIANAIRYTERGGVLVGCRRRGHFVSIEVWDTGIGIPQEQQSEIFREFVQLSNAERNRERGLGLGLAILRRLSLLLDHPVALTSKLGRGSKFSIRVPIAESTSAAASVTLAPAKAPSEMRIMVVDDDQPVREATVALLADWGHEALSATDESEAQRAFESGFVPHVLIVDYRLGEGQNGVQVAQRLVRRLASRPLILFISGDPLAQDALELAQSGALLLNKPLSPSALRAAIAGATSETARVL
ncbi:MAG: ATP-binding protein [Burkholderiaceae bacterium]